jgi:hypothetical protein
MVDQAQRDAWSRANQELLDELAGRRPRPRRRWVPVLLVGALFTALLVWGQVSIDHSARDRRPDWSFSVTFGLLGLAGALLVAAVVLMAREASWKGLDRDAARRMVRLVRSADPADPEQRWWAEQMARRLVEGRSQVFSSSAMIALMLSLTLWASSLPMLLMGLLVLALHLWVVAVTVVQLRTARRFLGQPQTGVVAGV